MLLKKKGKERKGKLNGNGQENKKVALSEVPQTFQTVLCSDSEMHRTVEEQEKGWWCCLKKAQPCIAHRTQMALCEKVKKNPLATGSQNGCV